MPKFDYQILRVESDWKTLEISNALRAAGTMGWRVHSACSDGYLMEKELPEVVMVAEAERFPFSERQRRMADLLTDAANEIRTIRPILQYPMQFLSGDDREAMAKRVEVWLAKYRELLVE